MQVNKREQNKVIPCAEAPEVILLANPSLVPVLLPYKTYRGVFPCLEIDAIVEVGARTCVSVVESGR